MAEYTRSTTRSRREANKPRFVHVSKWIDMVADENGNPKPVVHFKTKVLSNDERVAKLYKRKWGRNWLSWRGLINNDDDPLARNRR